MDQSKTAETALAFPSPSFAYGRTDPAPLATNIHLIKHLYIFSAITIEIKYSNGTDHNNESE
jgi:hypothetical protein